MRQIDSNLNTSALARIRIQILNAKLANMTPSERTNAIREINKLKANARAALRRNAPSCTLRRVQVSPASGGKIAFGDLTATDILTAGLSDHAVFLVAHKKLLK